MSVPLIVAVNFIGRQDWSVILQKTHNRALQQPAFGGVQESAAIRAVEEQALPDNYSFEIVCHCAIFVTG